VDKASLFDTNFIFNSSIAFYFKNLLKLFKDLQQKPTQKEAGLINNNQTLCISTQKF
jgi:hypothetical protein